MKKLIRTVIYRCGCARNSGLSVAGQKEELTAFAANADLKIIDDFSDNTHVYNLQERLQLKQLIKAAHNKKFDCVLVWKFSYFAAGITHLHDVLKEFTPLGIRFISLQDEIDTKGPIHEELIAALQLVMQIKAAFIRERTLEGLTKARSKGKKLGRPLTPAPANVVKIVEQLAAATTLPIYKIRAETNNQLTYKVTRDIVQKVRNKS